MTYPKTIPRVEQVEVIGPYELRVTFDDGLVRELDLSDQLSGAVFEQLTDPARFAQVGIEGGTISWPNEADIDPVVLHGDEDPEPGPPLRVIREGRAGSV